MKKYQILLSSILALGTASCGLYANAYEMSINVDGSLDPGPLESYEASALDQIAKQLKGVSLPEHSRIRVTINREGKFSDVTFLAPRPPKEMGENLLKKIASINLPSVPGVDGPTELKLEFDASELISPPYHRHGISIQSSGTVTVSGPIEAAPTPNNKSTKSEEFKRQSSAAYTERDKEFDKRITDIYKEAVFPKTSFDLMFSRNDTTDSGAKKVEAEALQKEKKYLAASLTFLQATKGPLYCGNLTEVKELLGEGSKCAEKLGTEQKVFFVDALRRLGRATSAQAGRYPGAGVILSAAKTFVNEQQINDLQLRLELEQDFDELYRKMKRSRDRIDVEKRILSIALEQIPQEPNMVSYAYALLADSLINEQDFSAANKVLDNSLAFHEKTFGSSSINVIPTLTKQLQISTAKARSEALISRIESIVEAYPVTPSLEERDAIRSFGPLELLNPVPARIRPRVIQYFDQTSPAESLSDVARKSTRSGVLLDSEESERLAKSAYELRLKTKGFDQKYFRQVCEALKKNNKLDQLETLYKNTLTLTELQATDSNLVKRDYTRFLNNLGRVEEADQFELTNRRFKPGNRDSSELRREDTLRRRNERITIAPILARVRLCKAALGSDSQTQVVQSLDDLAKDLGKIEYQTEGRDLSRETDSLLIDCLRFKNAPSLEPQLVELGKALEQKTKTGINQRTINRLFNDEFPDTSLARKLANRFYEIKCLRLKDNLQVTHDWLADLVEIAEKQKHFEDAIKFQTNLLDRLKGDVNASIDAQLYLARLQLAAGQKESAKTVCLKAIKDLDERKEKCPSDNKITVQLAKASTAFSKSNELVVADQLARQAIDSLLMQREMRYGESEVVSSISNTLERYETRRNYQGAISLLSFATLRFTAVRGAENEQANNVRGMLSSLLLDASLHDKKKSYMIAQSDELFRMCLKVEKTKGVGSYNRLIRARVEKLDKLGYEEQAKSLEKLLEL